MLIVVIFIWINLFTMIKGTAFFLARQAAALLLCHQQVGGLINDHDVLFYYVK